MDGITCKKSMYDIILALAITRQTHLYLILFGELYSKPLVGGSQMKIIGRENEKKQLQSLLSSNKPEFAALYGRRRVGKTFLIREFFQDDFTFYHTGVANADRLTQLDYFGRSLGKYGADEFKKLSCWADAFEQLRHILESTKKRGKKIVFLDELPWMDTPKSGFLTALEYFWNSWASAKPDILLIVCGSATSWIINNIMQNHGGLHNRVTRRILLNPFTLAETEEYLRYNDILLERKAIAEAYMILGGIPFYLNMMERGLSLSQNIDNICFGVNAPLQNEFDALYASLFKNSADHVSVVHALSQKKSGLTRDEIIRYAGISSGGGLSKTLLELEQSGFIYAYNDFSGKNGRYLYQLVDFFSLFHLNFMDGKKRLDEHFWTNFTDNAKRRIWSGYAYEQLCLAHIHQIKSKLGISGVLTQVSSWRSRYSIPGAQIDLVIDRNDSVINLCEIKFSNTEFVIDKDYCENLRKKEEAFRRESKSKKSLHLTLISTFGVKYNAYSSTIQSEIVLDDMFKP
jgi:predicted AAA+ superfamily ATPase